MKLYLSSYRIPNIEALKSLFDGDFSTARVALIPNAKDYYAKRAKDYKTNEAVESLAACGFKTIETVDLQDYNNPETLKSTLKEFQCIWVAGGNTFCLREEMQKSGFDQIVAELLNSGIVYGGESAGALITGTTLEGVELTDNPEFAEKTIWEGLNILPNVIIPHVDSEYFGDSVSRAVELHKNNPGLIELTDQQALVIDDENQEIVEGTDNETL